MPLMASLVFEIRPTILFKVSPAMPHLEDCQWCARERVRCGLPVCIHADLHCWVCQDSGSPFSVITSVRLCCGSAHVGYIHRVNLGHQSTVDKTSLVKDLVTTSSQHQPHHIITRETYPFQSGCAPRILSQIALCSRAKRVCSSSMPVHQLSENPVLGFPSVSRGRKASSAPLVSRRSLPSSCWSRSSLVLASLEP
jgi:hypothetical protein